MAETETLGLTQMNSLISITYTGHRRIIITPERTHVSPQPNGLLSGAGTEPKNV